MAAFLHVDGQGADAAAAGPPAVAAAFVGEHVLAHADDQGAAFRGGDGQRADAMLATPAAYDHGAPAMFLSPPSTRQLNSAKKPSRLSTIEPLSQAITHLRTVQSLLTYKDTTNGQYTELFTRLVKVVSTAGCARRWGCLVLSRLVHFPTHIMSVSFLLMQCAAVYFILSPVTISSLLSLHVYVMCEPEFQNWLSDCCLHRPCRSRTCASGRMTRPTCVQC